MSEDDLGIPPEGKAPSTPHRQGKAKRHQCIAIKADNGQRCKNLTADSTRLCSSHIRQQEEKDHDKFLKCHKCMRVKWKDADTPDVELTRMENCPKAFWKSQGKRKMWLRDLCWYDTQALNTDLTDPDEVLMELVGIVRDEGLQLDKARRFMADEGGLMTPDYMRLTSQRFSHLETLRKMLTGGVNPQQAGLMNARPEGPPAAGPKAKSQKSDLLAAIFGASDGFEDEDDDGDLEITREEKTRISKKPRRIRLEAEDVNNDPLSEPDEDEG